MMQDVEKYGTYKRTGCLHFLGGGGGFFCRLCNVVGVLFAGYSRSLKETRSTVRGIFQVYKGDSEYCSHDIPGL